MEDVGTPELTDGTSHDAPSKRGCRFGVRHQQIGMVGLGILFSFMQRTVLSVTVVAIIDRNNANPDFPQYDWDEGKVSILLSSFYWGYPITQIFGGHLADKFGPKRLLFLAMFLSSIINIMFPIAARIGGWQLVAFCRASQGLFHGFLFPAANALLAQWSPLNERGKSSSFVFGGSQTGTVIALPVCGLLATSMFGWPSCFYLFGALGFIWSVVWYFIGRNKPSEHSKITQEEKNYIESSIGTSVSTVAATEIPWKAIFTSVPIWSILIANSGNNWVYVTFLTEIPTYIKTVLKFDLKLNGVLSAVPDVVMICMTAVFSISSDYINKKELVSLTASRKIFNTIGMWIPAAALVGLNFVTDPVFCIILLTIAVSVNSSIYVGYNINTIDLAPNFAGTLMGISNGLGSIASLFAPLIVGVIVTEPGSSVQWGEVFLISAAMYFFSNLIYLIFTTSKLQKWNDLDLKPSSDEKKVDLNAGTYIKKTDVFESNT